MYLIAIHVPIHVDQSKYYLSTEWLKSVRLLRDSFAGRYGPINIIAPSHPYDPDNASQTLEEVVPSEEDIEVFPSFDSRCRSRHYWLQHRRRWQQELKDLVSDADVVHAGLDDVYRPISYEGFLEGRRQNKATVFVQDTDIALQTRQLSTNRPPMHRLRAAGYANIFERLCRDAVSTASLSMLKGTRLMNRYGPYQKNAQLFHDTSYSIEDIVDEDFILMRCERLRHRLLDGGPLRFMYCGRLTPRKGLVDSIEIIAKVVAMGGNVQFDIIGDGEQRDELQTRIDALHLNDRVRLLGNVAYGPELFDQIRQYDALLFTPLAEDTPRMIFDAYAAGLPLIAYDIDYVVERKTEEDAALVLPNGDIDGSAEAILSLTQQPHNITTLSFAARDAAEYHASENWYFRRAQWTIEAVDRHRLASGVTTIGV
ncbi:glycosyltransferase family 4 protein [Stieleria marina]|uniref:Alpha-D-kanosaminyltransferase n=1 Tax=Stieleria marina TaxID=1930275 RepID=A0A517NNT6_9BACT|nr:Alpha-D-kanosaminyltransferase [Planctomycetes bacterium K23_9]